MKYLFALLLTSCSSPRPIVICFNNTMYGTCNSIGGGIQYEW